MYDRDYAREPWGAGASRLSIWTATKLLIATNVAVFVVQLFLDSFLKTWFALHPEDVIHRGFLWQLVTYAFLHDAGNVFHLFFNMLFLWWFGGELEEIYGSRRFLGVYLGSGIFGGLVQTTTAFLTGRLESYALGASACVLGLLVLATLRDPRRIVYLWMIILVPIQLRFLTLFYVAVDLLGFARGDGGVAYAAHLGGAAWGALWWLSHERGVGLRVPWPQRRRRRLRLVEPRREGPAPEIRAEVDRLLEKISSGGIDSLTAAEREYLARASREFRH